MRVTFEGHAFVSIETNGRQILIDPWITGNPVCNKSVSDFHPDIILVTHGHDDHLGDAVEIARSTGAILAGQVDLFNFVDTEGCEVVAFHIGGTAVIHDIPIMMTQAWHGSTVDTPDGPPRYAGVACGFIIKGDTGNVYHAGDTGLFGDMGTVISRYGIDLALLPIGDFFTMGPVDAITAANWLHARYVVPIHFNTNPRIAQDGQAFVERLNSRTNCHGVLLQVGESFDLPAKDAAQR